MSTMLIQSGTLDDIADAIRAKTGGSASMTPLQMPTQIASIPSGSGANILSGDMPLSSQGSEGDIYFQYLKDGIRAGNGTTYADTGYSGNDNSEYVIEFMITQNQTSTTPVMFGAKPSSGDDTNAVGVVVKSSGSNHLISVYWGASAVLAFTVPNTSIVNKFVRIELKSGLCKLIIDGNEQTFTFTPTSITSTTNIFLWAMGVNGARDTNTLMRNVWLYKFEISENGNVIHRFLPYKKTSTVFQLYDEITEEYITISNPAAWNDSGTITTTYRKINGVWTNAIGADINDIITS